MIDLSFYRVSPTRGFLPEPDPLQKLPHPFAALEEIAQEMPKLLGANRLREAISKLPLLEMDRLQTDPEKRRAMMLYSYLGHGFIWGSWKTKPAQSLPPQIAIPWHHLSKMLGRPPILSYESYALDNWRRIDPKGPIELGNIGLLQNFLGGLDEEWFILVHVEIEAKAAAALAAIPSAKQAVGEDQPALLLKSLQAMESAWGQMYATLLRMRENCDPYVYYQRVRPYIHGFVYHPVTYEGVEEYKGQPQKFFGETGAQSSIVPSFDAFLGIEHADDPLKRYLVQMKDYMPTKHQAFMAAVKEGPSVRKYIEERRANRPLLEVYNQCVEWLRKFRTKHIEFAVDYIEKQNEASSYNPTQIGTGGTPFIPYLTKHRDETVGL